MHVTHVVPGIAEEASGPSYSVVRLCESLVENGLEVTLAALDWAPMATSSEFLKTFPLGIGPRRFGRSPAMRYWLSNRAKAGMVDVLHNHGMWQFNAVYPGEIAARFDIPYLVSPRGAFSEWAFSHGSRMKAPFWRCLQKPSFKAVTVFHATAFSEYEDIRRMGFEQPVAIVPNGIDLPTPRKKIGKRWRTLLFLGRVHPVKGLDLLLPAWHAVQDSFPDWRLRIVGSDAGFHKSSGYMAQMQRLSRDLGLQRVTFSGALYGDDKWQAYADADLFVLPTYTENFGVSVAESLAAGTPVVCTKGAPWAGLELHGAGRWIEIGSDALAAAMGSMMALGSDELEAMGQRGRRWMVRKYSWERIGEEMTQVYEWILGRRPAPPACIKFD